MTSRSWFVPKPGYDGPPIELTCGRHTKDGRFIPKNVRLTLGYLAVEQDAPSTDSNGRRSITRRARNLHGASGAKTQGRSCRSGGGPIDRAQRCPRRAVSSVRISHGNYQVSTAPTCRRPPLCRLRHTPAVDRSLRLRSHQRVRRRDRNQIRRARPHFLSRRNPAPRQPRGN